MIVNRTYIIATIRDLLTHSRAPRIGALIGGVLVLLGLITGILAVTTTQPVSAGSTCTPNTSYSLPTTLSLTTEAPGLALEDDGISTYGIGGGSVEAIRSALATCAPSFIGSNKTSGFLAYTSYTINWDYDVVATGNACRLDNVKVGLHLSQLEPNLDNSLSNDPVVQAKWNTFITDLRAHEDGHKALDIEQAQQLVAELTSLRATCEATITSAQGLTNATLQDLVAVNANHDALTDYGRTQGATW